MTTSSGVRYKALVDCHANFALGDPEIQKKVFDEWNTTGGGPLGKWESP